MGIRRKPCPCVIVSWLRRIDVILLRCCPQSLVFPPARGKQEARAEKMEGAANNAPQERRHLYLDAPLALDGPRCRTPRLVRDYAVRLEPIIADLPIFRRRVKQEEHSRPVSSQPVAKASHGVRHHLSGSVPHHRVHQGVKDSSAMTARREPTGRLVAGKSIIPTLRGARR